MKEILYKAKRIDNGEWVYGIPLPSKFGCTYMITIDGATNADFYFSKLTIPLDGAIAVQTETIGQYIGIEGKNQEKLFCGDKILYKGAEGIIFYDNDSAMFMVRFDYLRSRYSFDSIYQEEDQIVKIGNIHEQDNKINK